MLSPDRPFANAADHRACRAAIKTGSRSFYAASWLLPPRVRRAAFSLYAFCRLSDDAIDEDGQPRLSELQMRLAAAYAGQPYDHPADRAFADLVFAHRLPREGPEALMQGFAWDCEGRRYADMEALHAYAARVAGSVGAMMTLLMGVRDPETIARACDLGVAMQLTNIARDVGEDARAGRLYLPLDWLAEAGVDPDDFLADPRLTPPLARVVARLLGEADRLYARSRAGVARLPLSCRPAILAAAAIYAEIGHEVTRRGYDSINARARVSGARKLALATNASLLAFATPTHAPVPPLPATAFLIEATARERPVVSTYSSNSFPARLSRVLDIFERLERADQTGWRDA